jgi:ribose/xylose/arabinose/galactoside ABC-type transport system permease subunit
VGPGLSSGSGRSRFLPRFLQRSEWGLLLAVVVVLLLTTWLDPLHTYSRNPRPSAIDILRQTTMLAIFSVGAAIVIIAGGIDLSSGSVIAFSGTVCASLLLLLAPDAVRNNEPLSTWVILAACLGALLSGFLVGSLHAWLITVINLPPFVATLATMMGLRSLSRAVVAYVNQGSTQIPIFNVEYRCLANSPWKLDSLPASAPFWQKLYWEPLVVVNSVLIPTVLCLAVVLITWLLLGRTVVGRHLYALGGNENAARLSGIRTDRLKWLAYCLSAVLASLAGILFVAEVAVIEPESLGKGYELNAIAAAVVGGCSLQGGVGTIPGTLLGALFLRAVMDGVAKIIKVSADVYEGLIVGTVVVVAVALTQLRQAGRKGQRLFPGALGVVNILNLALLAGMLTLLFGQSSSGGAKPTTASAVTGITLTVLLAVQFFQRRRVT